jgi:Protein inscuteable C-terminal
VDGLTKHVHGLIATLTNLAQLHCGDDTLLLVTAALANLSFMEPSSLLYMKQLATVKTLLERVQTSLFTSVFARDQVVTVMANVAANSDGKEEVMARDSIDFLAGQLLSKVEDVSTHAEQAAVERILKKSAIALCRVCHTEETCYLLQDLGVVERAAELCKFPSTRNYSDAVLVACLALLRRLGSMIPLDVDQSLLQDSLVDSFRELSMHQESYV